ncbi:Uu.00g043290.m01.CDS01 [Anthostomella pinea]|uniref:Uu.00g043290.m01.CDS01 n=1 Tax=Anthostomella pinea TaxID=933095 RepID=A0AAI8VBR9_9PEZI|nr:Uu.00g043290.m01.CDS01 [Anthostomella pinea]
MVIAIARAGLADLRALAEINQRTSSQEPVFRFAFKDGADRQTLVGFFEVRIASRFDDPLTEIFKAVDDSTGEIAGYACWTLEPLGKAKEPPTGKVIQNVDMSCMNLDFVMAAGVIAEKLNKYRKGEEHYYLSGFAVTPLHQGQGIGTQLLKHCLQLADKASLPTWLTALPGSHTLYLREGFTDVDHQDFDLNSWDRDRCRGYGIYRQYAMVRRSS